MTQGGELKVKSRLVASGVAALAIASIAVPAALGGSASATTPSASAPTLTACAPIPAVIGKTVTLTGTGLANATVTVGKVPVAKLATDTGKKITFKVPKGVKTKKAGDTVKVTTANGGASLKCTFTKAPKK